MAKRSTARHNDRIVNTVTGEMGTVIDVHSGTTPKGAPSNYTVLPDDGPRAAVLWLGAEVEWSEPTGSRKCHRCGDPGHWAYACPAGDLS